MIKYSKNATIKNANKKIMLLVPDKNLFIKMPVMLPMIIIGHDTIALRIFTIGSLDQGSTYLIRFKKFPNDAPNTGTKTIKTASFSEQLKNNVNIETIIPPPPIPKNKKYKFESKISFTC